MKLLLVLLFAFSPLSALAQNLSVTGATVSGTCSGTAEASFDEKTKVILVKLPEFVAKLDADSGVSLVRSTCNLVISTTVPDKKRIRLTKQALQTELELPPGSSANFSIEAFFPGVAGAKLQPKIISADHVIKGFKLLNGPLKVKGGCGISENLRANLSIVINPKPLNGVAKVSASEFTLEAELDDCVK